jgi:hypothetical protein
LRNHTVLKRRKLDEQVDLKIDQSPLEIKVAAASGSKKSHKAEVFDPSSIPEEQ